jgi:hypothetical protein
LLFLERGEEGGERGKGEDGEGRGNKFLIDN